MNIAYRAGCVGINRYCQMIFRKQKIVRDTSRRRLALFGDVCRIRCPTGVHSDIQKLGMIPVLRGDIQKLDMIPVLRKEIT